MLLKGFFDDQVNTMKQAIKQQVRQNAGVTMAQKRIVKNQEFRLPTFNQQFVPIVTSSNVVESQAHLIQKHHTQKQR